MLTYLIGSTRAGKTTYSMRCAGGGGPHHVPFDKLWNYSLTAEEQWDNFAAIIRKQLDEHGDVIVDGMMGTAIEMLKRDFPEAQAVIVYTAFDIVVKRARKDALYGWTPDSLRGNMVTYYQRLIEHNPYFIVGSDSGTFTTMYPIAFFQYLGDPWKTKVETWLMDRMNALNCDVQYSPIKIGDVSRPGYERAVETLARIRGLLDWTGRRVLEYGPHMAYAALHYYARLAGDVKLVERSADACRGVSEMANYLGLRNITTVADDMMTYQVKEKPDIVLCLNMFYGLPDKKAGAEKLWEQDPAHIIVETNEQDFKYLDEVAASKGYKRTAYPGRTNCSGYNRLIVHYSRD